MDEFFLPSEPGELWSPDSELAGLRCEAFTDLAGSAPEEIGEIAESAQLPPVQLLPATALGGWPALRVKAGPL